METTSSAGLFFSSAQPAAVDLPHLITALDAELIGKVAHLTKSKIGLWKVPAPFDEQDVFERAREAAPLSAWMLPANQAEIRKSIDRALELMPKASEREQALIKALAERHGTDPAADRAPFDKAYASAMRRVPSSNVS